MAPDLLDDHFRHIERTFNAVLDNKEVDEEALGRHLEAVSSFRGQIILLLIRKVVALLNAKGAHHTPIAIRQPDATFIIERFGWLLLNFFGHRQVAMAMDIISGWLADKTASCSPERFAEEIIRIIAAQPYATKDKIEAAIHGASGMHCYTPGQLIDIRNGGSAQ